MRFIHVVGLKNFAPFYYWVLFYCIDISESVYHLTVDRLLSYLQFGVITNKAAMNICVKSSCRHTMEVLNHFFSIPFTYYILISNTTYYSAVILTGHPFMAAKRSLLYLSSLCTIDDRLFTDLAVLRSTCYLRGWGCVHSINL